MSTLLTSKKLPILALILLTIAYIVVRVGWYATYPPLQNYDHFNTETTLNVLANPDLYPTDPIWQNGGQSRSLGFLFVGFMRLMELIFGEYTAAWNFMYALHLVLFLPGAFLFFRFLTREFWLSALFALISSIPFYLYFSFTSWGINSPYARTFVTVQTPWLFLMAAWLLQQEVRPLRWWLAFAVWVGSIVFWNPVYGLALIEIFAFAFLIEWWGGRITWREWVWFISITGVLFVVYYLSAGSTLTATSAAPLTQPELQRVVDMWVKFAGLHFFPWAVTQTQALWVVIAASLGSILLLFSAPIASGKEIPSHWWVIGLVVLLCQVPAPMIMTRDFTYLLIIGYWVYRYRQVDRWDVLLVSAFTAINLASLVQSALGYYLFTEHKVLQMASFAFEGYRPIRWAFWLLFLFVGRWCADLLQASRAKKGDALALLAIVFLVGASITRMGHVGHDDGMIVRPLSEDGQLEGLRQALVFIAIGLGLGTRLLPYVMKRVGEVITLPLQGGIALACIYPVYQEASHLPDFYQTIFATYAVGAILVIAFLLWWWSERQQRLWVWGLFGAYCLPLIILPISDYYRAKPDFNTSDDFNRAAQWAKEHTPNEALFLPYNLDAMPFRAQSERSVLTWDLLQTYYFLGPRQLLESESFIQQYSSLNPQEPDAFRQTVDGFEVDFIVADNRYGLLPYPTVFYSDEVSIYYPIKKATREAYYSLPTRGMAEATFAAYTDFAEDFDLVPADETILMPGTALQRPEALQALGFMTTFQSDPTPIFELMILLERMRHQHELPLEDVQQTVLNQWNASKQPQFLEEAGIHYLLVDDRWWGQLGDDQRVQLEDPAHYELLGEWEGLTSAWYRLYRIP